MIFGKDNPGVAQNLGHFLILIDASKLGPTAWLHAQMEEFQSILRETPAADPAYPVMSPGEREMKAYAKHRRDGVAVSAADLEAVRGVCTGSLTAPATPSIYASGAKPTLADLGHHLSKSLTMVATSLFPIKNSLFNYVGNWRQRH